MRFACCPGVSMKVLKVADPADVLAGQGAPPDPGVPPLPPLPIAAIPLPDGMAAPLAAFGAVPVGLFG